MFYVYAQLLTMNKLLFFLVCSASVFGQVQIDRVFIKGQVRGDADVEVEGIHIYNISSQNGTITDEEGIFEISVAENDRLEITAIQIAGFKVIITQKVIERGTIDIYLNSAINKLDEVVLIEHDLTGILYDDVASIKTVAIENDFDISYESLEFGYDFAPDGLTAIQGNAAEEALGIQRMQNGFNILAVGGLLAKLIFGTPKKKPTRVEIDRSKDSQLALLSKKFDETTLLTTYGIPKEHASDFRYFLIESYIPSSYLLSENQLLLYAYVTTQSTLYKEQIRN